MGGEELDDQVQDRVDALVHEALHPLLLEEAAADGRIALELQPLAWLFIEFPGQGQVAQVEVRAEEAQEATIPVLQALDGGEGRAAGIAADIDRGEGEALAGQGLRQIRAIMAIAPQMLGQGSLGRDVRRDLARVGVQDVEIFARGQRRKGPRQDRFQGLTLRPG